MNRLLEIGFEPVGHWKLENENLRFELTRHATQANILYAFVCDGTVMYVGKTIRKLRTRMSGYKTPGMTQTTNINNNTRITEELTRGAAIEIFALPDNGLLHYGVFHLNLAAALEDDIIRKLNPPWNGGRTETARDIPTAEDNEQVSENLDVFTETFHLTLHPTYWNSGFFNVGTANQKYFGADGEKMEIFLGNARQPVLGTINRTANNNGTPRIMGGTAVRDWFQEQAQQMDSIAVQVLSPTSIRLAKNVN